MLRTWIRHSIANEFQENFAYVTSSKRLWDSIKEKLGQTNRIVKSKLKKVITNLKWGDMFVTAYYTKLSKLMNKLETI